MARLPAGEPSRLYCGKRRLQCTRPLCCVRSCGRAWPSGAPLWLKSKILFLWVLQLIPPHHNTDAFTIETSIAGQSLRRCRLSPASLPVASSHWPTQLGETVPSKARTNPNKKSKAARKNANKPRASQKPDSSSRTSLLQLPRPVLNSYDENRLDLDVNMQRQTSSIGCRHFGTCPGCIVDTSVATVDVIRSAKSYFDSSAIRRHRREGDDFFQVVVPSKITGWRTQAKLAVAPKTSSWKNDGAGRCDESRRHFCF
jgi:hypothetical protein